MPIDNSLKALTQPLGRIAEITDDPNYKKLPTNVKEIRDAVCGNGILGILSHIDKNIEDFKKKDSIARLTGKKSTSINQKSILRSTNSIESLLGKILGQVQRLSGNGRRLSISSREQQSGKIKGLESLSRYVDIAERLKFMKLKDFLFAKRKMNIISKLITKTLDLFRSFKNQKEIEGTLSLANSSIELAKKLSKISLLSKPAQMGVNVIERIFIGKKGKGGLLKIFKELSKNKRQIDRGKESIKDILKSCGSMLLTSMILTGVAVVGIPAMLGALFMKGIVWILSGTFKMLNKAKKNALIGSTVLLIMSTSVITFALGLGLMVKAVKGMEWKDFGKIMASLAGVSLTVAGIGLLSVPIAIGSASLLLMGASLGILALSLRAWKNFDSKSAMTNIKDAVGGLKEAFGLDEKSHPDRKTIGQKLGGGLMDIAVGVLNFGKTFFMVGSLLLTGVALGILYRGVKVWQNFNAKKSAENIKTSLGVLKDAFGLKDRDGESVTANVKGGLNDLIGLASSIFQMGKTFTQMGSLVFATAMMDIIRLTLIPWESYNATAAVGNMKIAFSGLTECFGLESSNTIVGSISSAVTNFFDLGAGLLKMGSMFTKMGTILIATATMDKIRENLDSWKSYDYGNSISNIKSTMTQLMDAFGIYNDIDDKSPGILKVVSSVGRGITNMFSLAENLTENGAKKSKLSDLVTCVATMDKVREYLVSWNSFDPKDPLSNMNNAIKTSVDSINTLNIFKAAQLTDVFRSFKNIGNKPFDKFTAAVNQFTKSCNDLIGAMKEYGNVTVTAEANGSTSTASTSVSGGVNINNPNDLAKAIAEAIKSLPINVETNLSDIRLVVNNEAGRRVVLTLEN